MRSSWWAELLPGVLDAVAEAAWIGAVYLLVQIAWGRDQLLFGIPQLALLVACGIAIGVTLRHRALGSDGRRAATRAARMTSADDGRNRDVAAAMSAVVLAGILGWAAAPDVRAALGARDLAAALSLHPGGWLAGLAVLRGLAHGDLLDEEREAAPALRVGLAALVIVWLLGRTIGGADHALFEDNAIVDTVTFMAAGLLGVGVAGMKALSRRSGPAAASRMVREGATSAGRAGDPAAGGGLDLDWRRNREWLLLLFTVVAAMIVIALPAISVAGRNVVETLLAVLWIATELVVLVVVVRAIPRAVTLSIPFLLGGLLIVLVLRLIGFRPDALAELITQVRDALRFAPDSTPGSGPGDAVTLLGALLVAVAIGVVVLLVRSWLRRRSASGGETVFEERSVVVEPTRFGLSRPRLRRPGTSRERPTDAVSAYRAVLEQLDAFPELGRGAGESPAEHSRRIAEWVPGARSIGRLALDYELARFGGRALSDREEARALRRWNGLQSELRRRPKPEPVSDEDVLEARARQRAAREHRDEEQRPFGT